MSILWDYAVADPGFPIGGVDQLGGRRPPTRTLFSENVKKLGPVGGVHHNFLYVHPPMLWYPLLGTGVTLLPLSFRVRMDLSWNMLFYCLIPRVISGCATGHSPPWDKNDAAGIACFSSTKDFVQIYSTNYHHFCRATGILSLAPEMILLLHFQAKVDP